MHAFIRHVRGCGTKTLVENSLKKIRRKPCLRVQRKKLVMAFQSKWHVGGLEDAAVE